MPKDSRSTYPSISEQPVKLAVDADGFAWGVFVDENGNETWSMARINPDNSPIPEPITYYFPVKEPDYAKIHADAKRIGADLEQRHE